MAYFSADEPMLGNPLGCGPSCSCGPCRSGMSGFNEWYEKEEEDDEPPFQVVTAGARANNMRQPLNGWYGGGGLGFFRLGEEAPATPPEGAAPPDQAPPPSDQPPATPQP